MIGRMVFMNVWTMISGLIALYILVFLAAVAGSVLFGCAVYNDAKSKWNDNATMWGVLVGILGLIPGIIYLCVRNEPLKRIYVCHNCGWASTQRPAVRLLRRGTLLSHRGDPSAAEKG